MDLLKDMFSYPDCLEVFAQLFKQSVQQVLATEKALSTHKKIKVGYSKIACLEQNLRSLEADIVTMILELELEQLVASGPGTQACELRRRKDALDAEIRQHREPLAEVRADVSHRLMKQKQHVKRWQEGCGAVDTLSLIHISEPTRPY